MPAARHVLINGLSIGGGGGLTVGQGLWRHVALARPQWTVTLLLITGHPFHEPLRAEAAPDNCRLRWAPPQARRYLARARYEGRDLPRWAAANGVDAVVQLNGMIVPALTLGLGLPTLAHFQDPWAYIPAAWGSGKYRLVALLKRRAHARALRHAHCAGWTSGYLRDLICGRQGIRPRRSEVFYNGIPQPWVDRARDALPEWESRPPQLVSVSNVSPYKRQDLVIRAMPRLLERPGLAALTYRIAGHCDPQYLATLQALVRELNLEQHVFIEGRVGDDRVRDLMRGSRCFVLMSICESFGIPAVEAMSFGTPVVTSDCCAMPEVCGDAADLCPADDVAALADRLWRVLTDAPHARELRRKGAARVERFGWPTTARHMAAVLDELMDARHTPGEAHSS